MTRRYNLSAKVEIPTGTSAEADATKADLATGIEELKRRMEISPGTKPEAA